MASPDIPRILLEQEQEELLGKMVEAARSLPRSQRRKFLAAGSAGGDSLLHEGLPGRHAEIYIGDIEALANKGLLALTYGSRGSQLYDVTPEGYQYYAYLKQRLGEPLANISDEIRRYLQGDEFERDHKESLDKWREAEELLWDTDSERQATTVGHLCRESMQLFATELIHRYGPANVDADIKHTVARLKSVLEHPASRLGTTESPFLAALVAYWGTVTDLVERQEHGAQKEGEALTWEDARRIVFHTAIVMFEVDKSLSKAPA